MKVEILETKRTDEFNEAEDKERQELLQTLGLEQKQTEKNIPFPELSSSQLKAIRIMYPNVAEALQYRNYIPTPVLRTINTWKPHFNSMKIYSNHDQDPVLVGEEGNTWFLLARWGEELYPLNQMIEKARQAYEIGRRALLEAALNNVKSQSHDYFAGRHVGYISPEDC